MGIGCDSTSPAWNIVIIPQNHSVWSGEIWNAASELGGVADERLHDVVLALGRVGAHVELDRLLDVGVVGASHGRKAHLLADEAPEVLLVDLAKSLEARDLAAAAALLYRILALLVGVAEVVLLLVPDAEERRLENEDAPVEDGGRAASRE